MITIKKSIFKELYDIACEDWKSKFDNKFKKFTFSDSIEFEESFLEEMRKACTEAQLKVFNKIFKNHLKSPLIGRIASYKEVCKELGKRMLTEEDFSFLPVEDRRKALAYQQIKDIEKLFNGNWKPNWKDINQYKYYPYFRTAGSGGWSFGYSISDYLCAFFGQVAYFKDKATSDYVGQTFKDIYIELVK